MVASVGAKASCATQVVGGDVRVQPRVEKLSEYTGARDEEARDDCQGEVDCRLLVVDKKHGEDDGEVDSPGHHLGPLPPLLLLLLA